MSLPPACAPSASLLVGRVTKLAARQFSDCRKEHSELDIDDGRVRHPVFDTNYAYFFCMNKIVLSEDDFADIIRHVSAISDDDSLKLSVAEFLITCLESRYARIGQRQNIVSLGTDCLPRTVATRWGYAAARAEGAKSAVFDLAIHPVSSLKHILDTEFEHYFDCLYFDKENNYPVSRRYNIQWNHEVGAHWADNDFSAFRERYAGRVETFKTALRGKRPLVMMHIDGQLPRDRLSDIRSIQDSLSAIAGRVVELLCVVTRGTDAVSDSRHLHICDAPVPYAHYSWPEHSQYVTREGLIFEQTIARSISRALESVGDPDHVPQSGR